METSGSFQVEIALQHNTLKMPMPAIRGNLYLMKIRFHLSFEEVLQNLQRLLIG